MQPSAAALTPQPPLPSPPPPSLLLMLLHKNDTLLITSWLPTLPAVMTLTKWHFHCQIVFHFQRRTTVKISDWRFGIFCIFRSIFAAKIWKLSLCFEVGSSPHFCIARFGSSCTLSLSHNMHPQPGPWTLTHDLDLRFKIRAKMNQSAKYLGMIYSESCRPNSPRVWTPTHRADSLPGPLKQLTVAVWSILEWMHGYEIL